MAEGGPTYKSYLLRLWRQDAEDAPWRASLESITQQEDRPRHFPDAESLIAFLLMILPHSFVRESVIYHGRPGPGHKAIVYDRSSF
jgi:hypothetical protein